MRKILTPLLAICLIAFLAANAIAYEDRSKTPRFQRALSEEEFPELIDPGLRYRYTSAQTDTYCIVWYDFEQVDWQGWTRSDFTAQVDNFFHVDDFAGLGEGDFGGLVAIEGFKSMWCGARPGTDQYMCSWSRAPGYGNEWDQRLQTDTFPITGIVTLSYHGYFDSEPEFDYTYVEYDAGGGNWVELATYDGRIDTIAVDEFGATQLQTKIRYRFVSDTGWSDQDGIWNTDGAAIVDSITISDTDGLIDFEDFEGAAVGDKDVGMWHSMAAPAFGLYSDLMSNLLDKDPCSDNFGTQVVFFVGSPNPSASYPGLFDTPFCTGPGGIEDPCQNDKIVSPVIDMTRYSTNNDEVQDADIPPSVLATLGGAQLNYTVYRDVPLANLVIYEWHVRNVELGTGCPGVWQDRFLYYYGPDKDYIFSAHDISDLVGADPIQVAVGVQDMCSGYYLDVGNCAAHTPSPWFDNVRVYRYRTVGPQWSFRDIDLFQDNFPEEEFNLESYVRADAANDLNPYGDPPIIRPGDSVVVDCTSTLGGGIAEDDGGPRVYCHVRCTDLRPAGRPNLYGPQLEGTYGHYVSDDGADWTVLQCDTAYTGAGNPVEDSYAIDLNDSLFTRGYMIEYYFKAYDNTGESSTLPNRAESHGIYFEWSCLPTGKSDILYVDDFGHRGGFENYGLVKRYFDPTFETVLPATNQPDVYQVNAPSSFISNGPGSRAMNNHLTTFYSNIIWDSGNLEDATITDGTPNSDKSDDLTLLINWMNTSEHDVSIWVLGDDIAFDLDQHLTTPHAIEFMSNWCGVDYVENSYYDLTGGREAGGVVSPLITGAPTGIFYHGGAPDQFNVFGGCPIVNRFDVLTPTANGAAALLYPDFEGDSYIAGIQAENTNAAGYNVRTMWFGFSFMYFRDIGPNAPMVRNLIFKEVIEWMQATTNPDITHGEVPGAYDLAQNFPNPFNPQTTIKFDMKAKGHVTLKIYNVAGQLVRTLFNGVKDAGSYKVTWDGMNNDGSKVASGVYFYKMDTAGYKKTLKMVLLR